MTVKLLKYDAARQALAEAHRVDEVKDIRDKAVAVAAYARQAQDRQLILHATEIKLRAERRTGELLRETAENGSRRTRGKTSSRIEVLPTLKKMGISEDQSSDWQKLAAIPEPEFERRIKAASGEPAAMTTAKILKPAKMMKEDPFEEQREVWAGVSGWLGRVMGLPPIKELRRVKPIGGARTALRQNLARAEAYITGLQHLRKEEWL